MIRLRMIGRIVREAKLGHITVVFLALFVACAVAVWLLSPEVGGLGDALWLCFQTVTTIGFGDTYTGAVSTRILLAVLSVVSIFYLAIITGVVVSYCMEIAKAQTRESLVAFMDELEHLDQKTPEELRDISERVKKFRRTQR